MKKGKIFCNFLDSIMQRHLYLIIIYVLLFLAWVGSLAFGAMFFMGPLTTVLCEQLGCRVVTCLGGILSFVGLLTTSFVTNFTLLYITYGLLWGAGTSFCYFASLVILPSHFRNHLSLAYGIAIAGAGLGVPPMTWAINQLIAHYDWRITMRILAGMSLLMCVSSLSYSRLEDKQGQRIQLQKRDTPRILDIGLLYKIKLRLLEFLSLNPWKNKAFAVWAISLSFIAFGSYIPFVFLVSMFSVFCSLSNMEDGLPHHISKHREKS